ncbi:hypothetical protein INR49_013386 [Caranx melampygus]|nr:hypothetical protein INR49_013386 [Caranx melampygus]
MQMELPSRPTLFDFHGVSMTKYFTDNWDNVQNFKARPDDIVIATYPKAAKWHLNAKTKSRSITECRSWNCPPCLDHCLALDELNALTTFPRIIKTHLPVQFFPKSFIEQNSKIIYVARNAKDNVVSYFHFDRMNIVQPQPGDWSSFLQRFMEGKMVFGSWYEHDTEREVNRLCTFLGLSATAELKRQVVKKVQFDNMKNDKMSNGSMDEVFDFKIPLSCEKSRHAG